MNLQDDPIKSLIIFGPGNFESFLRTIIAVKRPIDIQELAEVTFAPEARAKVYVKGEQVLSTNVNRRWTTNPIQFVTYVYGVAAERGSCSLIYSPSRFPNRVPLDNDNTQVCLTDLEQIVSYRTIEKVK